MALVNVDNFTTQDGLDNYNIAFDSGTLNFVVDHTGPNPAAIVTEADRGRVDNSFIGSYIEGTTQYNFYSKRQSPFARYTTEPYIPPDPDPGAPCNLAISSLTHTDETQQSGNDGTVTVMASSVYGNIRYSLNNVTFQSSGYFQSLSPGNYIVYVTDDNDCKTQQGFEVLAYNNPVVDFTTGLPIVIVPNGNTSRWNAVFNPVVFTYQRRDFLIESIVQQNSTQIKVTLTTALSVAQYIQIVNGKSYVKSPKYDFNKEAVSHAIVGGKSVIIFTYPYLGDDNSGFINVYNYRNGYKIQTEVTSGDNPVDKTIITAEHSPSYTGETKADLAVYLSSLLQPKETYNYLLSNYRDTNLGASYTVRYREVWDAGVSVWHNSPYPLYVTYAAMQLGEVYGGNMAAYVPFKNVSNVRYRAKWLTDMEQPTLWLGLPFEMSFIYSEDLIGVQLYLEVTPDVGVSTEGALLNADNGYIVSADTSRILIERIYNPNIEGYPVLEQLGVNRVLIPQANLANASKATVNLYYKVGDTRVYIMQTISLHINKPCKDPYVHLKWINSRGAWDYWRFGFNQALSLTSSSSQEISRFVKDWANDDTINDYISRNANEKLVLVAGQVDKASLHGLRWLNNSIKAQMLVSGNPVKWQTVIVPDGDFSAYNTNQPSANVKLSIQLVDKNIQRQ